MFDWLKRLFSNMEEEKKSSASSVQEVMPTKPCRTCGKPISYDPSWKHIPNYCKECKAKYQAEHDIPRIMRRKCKRCGRSFTFPSTIPHYPNYCRDCRAKFKEKKA